MPSFISKLQYTDSEIGEFFDEQVRDLDSTIKLINDFPWQYQRRYIDNNYTGPSVTIQNEHNDYLKVSIHNGSEFWLLLLKSARLYEYPIENLFSLEEVITQVTLFFSSLTNISEFKKLRFELFIKRHFISKPFIYRRSVLLAIVQSWLYLLFFAFNIFVTTGIFLNVINHPSFLPWLLLPLAITVYILRCLVLIVIKFTQYRNSYIQISETRNEFVFSHKGLAKTYHKTDIKKIITHTVKNYKSPSASFVAYEIYFKDESFIKFSNLLFGGFTVADKFNKYILYVDKQDLKLNML